MLHRNKRVAVKAENLQLTKSPNAWFNETEAVETVNPDEMREYLLPWACLPVRQQWIDRINIRSSQEEGYSKDTGGKSYK